jgi:hypothetical protein
VGNVAASPHRAASTVRAANALCAAALCWLASTSTRAQDAANDVLNLPFELHGFVSQGFLLSSKNNYLAVSKPGSAEFTEVGLNVTKNLTDQFRMGVQLFARDLGPVGNYQPTFDWFYLDYRFWDWLGVRAGRNKIPFGLYNEINDVDVARVPILLPQSVYPIDHRDYLLAQTGIELYGNIALSVAGALEYRAYAGTLFLDAKSPNPAVTVSGVTVPYVVGGRLMWLTPIDGLQVGASVQLLRFDAKYQFSTDLTRAIMMRPQGPANFNGSVPIKFRLQLWVASLEYSAHDLLFAAEYSRWHGTIDSGVEEVLPDSSALNERFYAMASYRVVPWFTAGVYYSGYYVDVHDRHGRDAYQHDGALTLRFDATTYWLFKLEGHLMRGTAALDSNLNGGKPLSELTRNWALLLLKTTGYF